MGTRIVGKYVHTPVVAMLESLKVWLYGLVPSGRATVSKDPFPFPYPCLIVKQGMSIRMSQGHMELGNKHFTTNQPFHPGAGNMAGANTVRPFITT